MSGELSWGGDFAPIEFAFNLVETQVDITGDAEATTAQGGSMGALGGGFRIKIDLPNSFPITYSVSALKISFGDNPGQILQLDKSSSRGTTIRAMVPPGNEAGAIVGMVWNINHPGNTAEFDFEYIDDRIPEVLQVLPARIYADVSSQIRVIITNLDMELVSKDDVEITMTYKDSGDTIGAPAVESLEKIDSADPSDAKTRITFLSVPHLIAQDVEVQVRVAFGGRASLFDITYVGAPSGSPIISSIEPAEGICTDESVKVKLRLTNIRMITDATVLHVSTHGNVAPGE